VRLHAKPLPHSKNALNFAVVFKKTGNVPSVPRFQVVVDGQTVVYRAVTLPNGTINVGTRTVGAP
ncbi:MAG: hypothetical protein WB627_02335, partial [Candidatus Acidiferrum sp.]